MYFLPDDVDEQDIIKLSTKPVPVLDHGFVRLVDVMGSDAAVVQAARVSYGAGTAVSRQDAELINYLMRHWHSTPFEMCEIKLHVKLPIFVARQWIRHRTASVNEYSGRYSQMKDEFYLPNTDRVQSQSKTNKQGSGDALAKVTAEDLLERMKDEQDGAYETYQLYLASDLSRELARNNLPVSNYTEWYWKTDLRNLFNFLRLRQDSHAQYEIRVYADVIYSMLKAWVPVCVEAYDCYQRNSLTLSAKDVALLRTLLPKLALVDGEVPEGYSKGEYQEFISKLKLIVDA